MWSLSSYLVRRSPHKRHFQGFAESPSVLGSLYHLSTFHCSDKLFFLFPTEREKDRKRVGRGAPQSR